jgi:hypothetical protein
VRLGLLLQLQARTYIIMYACKCVCVWCVCVCVCVCVYVYNVYKYVYIMEIYIYMYIYAHKVPDSLSIRRMLLPPAPITTDHMFLGTLVLSVPSAARACWAACQAVAAKCLV